MKLPRKLYGFSVNLLRVFTLITLIAESAAAEDKKIVDLNGGFEINEARLPTKWSVFGPSEGYPTISRENPHGGSSFLRVPIGSFSSAKISGVQQSPPANLFKPGDTVTISAYVRLKNNLEEGTSVKVSFEVFGPDEKVLIYALDNPKNTPGVWQTLTSSVIIPSTFGPDCRTKVVASVFCKNAPTQENMVDFDDIVLSISSPSKQPAP